MNKRLSKVLYELEYQLPYIIHEFNLGNQDRVAIDTDLLRILLKRSLRYLPKKRGLGLITSSRC